MAERYLFFNSTVGDQRTYQASDFAEYFGSVLSTGLLHTDNVPGVSVSVETGTLNTVVSTGKAIMKGQLYENTTDLTLSHSIPEPTLNRIDRIVLRLDLRNSELNILLHVKEGVASSTPVAPVLQRDNFIHEISLAQIVVRANTVQLLQSDLVDERLDETLCGLVYSLISIPTSQFQAEWDAFMADIQGSGFATVGSVTTVSDALTTHKAEDAIDAHNASNISTTSGSNVQTEINTLKSSVSDGKNLLETTIIGKGRTVSKAGSIATFAELDTGVFNLSGSSVKSVQKGAISLISNVTDTTVAINPVNASKSIILMELRKTTSSNITNPRYFFVSAEFLNNTSIVLKRGLGSISIGVTVFWQVIEFEDSVNVQSGQLVLSTVDETIAINAVGSEAVCFTNYRVGSSTVDMSTYSSFNPATNILSATSLRINKPGVASAGLALQWFVVDF